MTKVDHIGITVADFPTSLAFYEAAMAPLGITVMMKFDGPEGTTIGMGSDTPFLWISSGGRLSGGRLHIAITAPNRAAVDAFHAAAIKAGGRDNGAPGLRPEYHPTYYGAFVHDPDGHNLEAVCHDPA
jgi:catechol 2,3-dioxygenase-like lactoylglutathione lyase family enzyme